MLLLTMSNRSVGDILSSLFHYLYSNYILAFRPILKRTPFRDGNFSSSDRKLLRHLDYLRSWFVVFLSPSEARTTESKLLIHQFSFAGWEVVLIVPALAFTVKVSECDVWTFPTISYDFNEQFLHVISLRQCVLATHCR